jgi:hypothetical protein
MRKLVFVGATLFAVIALCTVPALPLPQAAPEAGDDAAQPQSAEIRSLRPDAIAVRLFLGVGDNEPQGWDGTVALDQGEILGLEGWRLRAGDAVTGPNAWKARSMVLLKAAGKGAFAKGKGGAGKKGGGFAKGGFAKKGALATGPFVGNLGPAVGPAGLIVQVNAPATATLSLSTTQGNATIPLAELASGAPRSVLGGRIEARRVPVHATLTATAGQEDFPAAASDGRDGAWVAYVDHQPRGPAVAPVLAQEPQDFQSFVPSDGGDQVKLIHFNGTTAERLLDVTPPGRDVWRPAVALEGRDRVVVVWSENRDGNWDLYARRLNTRDGAWTGAAERLTEHPGADTDAVLATTADGRVWMAWQAWLDGQADIQLAPVDAPGLAINISNDAADDWSPALAIGPDGRPCVAFDSYRNGNYDVFLYRDRSAGAPGRLIAVADSTRFEARPSLAVDARGRAWIGYEERGDNWGKDFGVHSGKPGVPLYRASTVRVRCVEGDKVYDTGELTDTAPGTGPSLDTYARVAIDRSGRPWLLYRHRQENNPFNSTVPVVGGIWLEYATARVGGTWSPPQVLPRSDNLLDNRPALVPTPSGSVLAFYSSDGRLHREGSATATTTLTTITAGTAAAPTGGVAKKAAAAAANARRVNNDLFVASLTAPLGAAEPDPGAPAARSQAAPPAHPNEEKDVARIRDHRVSAGGKTYQLLRGEFHRHTDISADGGGDGTLEDMWRYALDVGALDWIGCGDHDNGAGREYTWWLTQKTTDLYHVAPRFNPMFTYERSVNYPGGHRNVMFARRGVRTLPRLMGDSGIQLDVGGRDLDAEMLYKYLRELNGICAAHTSATTMGTDWRANDPKVEPFVEIYQGDRDSYEYFGAPRVAHGPADAVGGWRPLGMVWNALALQYKLGFQSSSDHISTHISFAVAIAERPDREAILDAFQRRHCYAATDNIVLDVRSGDHLMGDEFTTDGAVSLKVMAHGTALVKRVDIIKDFHHVYSAEPNKDRVEFTWTDEDGVNRAPSWYYVRVLQEDGEIAWGSPMWITRGAGGQ